MGSTSIVECVEASVVGSSAFLECQIVRPCSLPGKSSALPTSAVTNWSPEGWAGNSVLLLVLVFSDSRAAPGLKKIQLHCGRLPPSRTPSTATATHLDWASSEVCRQHAHLPPVCKRASTSPVLLLRTQLSRVRGSSLLNSRL